MKKTILLLCAAVSFVCISCKSKFLPVVGVWEANVTMQSELDSTTKIVPAATLLTKQHIIWTFLDDETFTWFVEQRVISISFTEPFANESESKEAFIKQFTKTLSFSGSYHQFQQTLYVAVEKAQEKTDAGYVDFEPPSDLEQRNLPYEIMEDTLILDNITYRRVAEQQTEL